MFDWSEAAQVFQLIDFDMPVVDLVAALAQQIADHVLARSFRTSGRGNSDESLVVASCASKLSSIASRILCLISVGFISLPFRLPLLESRRRQYTAASD